MMGRAFRHQFRRGIGILILEINNITYYENGNRSKIYESIYIEKNFR